MGNCPIVPSEGEFISSITGYIDCQAQVLGSGAWLALAAPGSTLNVVLTGFLTIFIALIGYNLLLGHGMTLRRGTLAAAKVGVIVAIATSWPAYRTLVYDLVTDGPSQLVAEIGRAAAVPGSDGSLTQRLDLADQALARIAILGGTLSPELATRIPPEPLGGFDAFALGGSKIIFELTAIAGLGMVRIIAGMMLALGPFFIAFFMFESTRSLFEGWIRVLGAAAFGGVGVAIVLGLEVALIEPWLSFALSRGMAGEALPALSTHLFVIACLFSMIVAGVLYACVRLTGAFRLAPLLEALPVTMEQNNHIRAQVLTTRTCHTSSAEAEHSRAAAVTRALISQDRWEMRGTNSRTAIMSPAASRSLPVSASEFTCAAAAPVGRSFRRGPHARVSAVASRRDTSA